MSERQRRSAKTVVEDMANELMRRPRSDENDAKLDLLETIASKMSWVSLFERIKFRHKYQQQHIQTAHWYQD